MQDQQFFTREMGARLRKIRLAATLTQAEKADRMGLKGKRHGRKKRQMNTESSGVQEFRSSTPQLSNSQTPQLSWCLDGANSESGPTWRLDFGMKPPIISPRKGELSPRRE
jgi:hypothetical protein